MLRKALRTARRAFRLVRPGAGCFRGSGSHRFSGFVPASDRYARNFAGNTGKASENGRYAAGRPTVGRTLLDYEKMDLDMAAAALVGCGRHLERVGSVDIVPEPSDIRVGEGVFSLTRRTEIRLSDGDSSPGRAARVFRRAGRKVAGQAACGRPGRRTGIGNGLRRIGRSAGRGLCAERALRPDRSDGGLAGGRILRFSDAPTDVTGVRPEGRKGPGDRSARGRNPR